jgi:UDP-N-acetylmuramyl pentapeptide synthase
MVLSEVLYCIKLKSVSGFTDFEVSSIIFDSRAVVKCCLFVAIKNNTQLSF